MIITILAFGVAREITGATSFTVNYDENLTVNEIKALLTNSYPRLKDLTSFAIAVNGIYASNDAIIKPGDELAIIPPVSGG